MYIDICWRLTHISFNFFCSSWRTLHHTIYLYILSTSTIDYFTEVHLFVHTYLYTSVFLRVDFSLSLTHTHVLSSLHWNLHFNIINICIMYMLYVFSTLNTTQYRINMSNNLLLLIKSFFRFFSFYIVRDQECVNENEPQHIINTTS